MTQRFIHAPCSSSTASSGDALTAARAPFVVGSLRSALIFVTKSRRAFTGVGPHEAIIGGVPGHEAAARAFRSVALEGDDLFFFLVRHFEVHRSTGTNLVLMSLPVVESTAFHRRLW